MWNEWLRKIVQRRMTAAAKKGTRLRLEALEHRDNPAAIFALGVESGQAPVVSVFDAATMQQKFTVTAYDSSFTGGVNVAVGDVNGDGTGDLITGTGVGGGPFVKVFSGVDGTLLKTITLGDVNARNGVSVAAADIDNDGIADIVIGTTLNNQPFMQVQKFSDGSVIQSLTPFQGTGAINVAAGDFDGDGTPDIAVAAGAGNGPRLLVSAGKTNAVLFNQFAFEEAFTGGVGVSMGDVNGDGKADVIASAGFNGGPRVKVFLGGSGTVLQNFFAYDSSQRGGVFATAFNADNSGNLDIVTGDGLGQPIQLKAFNATTLATLTPPSLPFVPTGSGTTSPTTTVATTTPGPTSTRPLTFTVTFSDLVNGFTQSDVTVVNGTIARFNKTGDTVYTVLVTPTSTSPVSVSVAANVASDSGGNGNLASNTSTVVVDTVGPTATISSSAGSSGGATNLTPIPMMMTFNEATTGFTLDDLTVTNGTATAGSLSPTSNTTFTFTVTPTNQGAVTVFLPAGKVTDTSGNANTASNTFSITFDSVAPTVTVTSTAPNPTNTSPIPFKVDFHETVTGFTESDIHVTNGSVLTGTLVDGGNGSFTFSVTPLAEGDVTVSIPVNAANDVDGNGNVASAPVTRTYDISIPNAPGIGGLTAASDTGTSSTDGITSDRVPTISGTAEAGAKVHVTIDNTAAVDVTANASGAWTFTPASNLNEGTHTVTATQTDTAGNTGPASNPFTFTIDITAPVPDVTSAATDPTSTSPIPFAVNFGEVVAGFDAADISVTNGALTAGSFQDTGNGTFTFAVDPAAGASVTVTVSIAAGGSTGITDVAGNFSTASNIESRTFNDPGL